MKLDYFLYNVFTNEPKGGGSLAIVEIPEDYVKNITDEMLIKIASDFNFPETVFIYEASSTNYLAKLRIFTITRELPMAGHPTIGAAHYLRSTRENVGNEFLLDLKVGNTKISFDKDGNAFMLQQAHKSRAFSALDTPELLAALSVDKISTKNLPIEFSSTGLEFLIIPIDDIDQLQNLKPNYEKIKTLLLKYDCLAIYLFSKVSNNEYKVRMFMLEQDFLDEDSATGSAAGSFTMYLQKNVEDQREKHITIEQGMWMSSPSTIYTSVVKNESGELVPRVGGKAIKIGQGILDLAL